MTETGVSTTLPGLPIGASPEEVEVLLGREMTEREKAAAAKLLQRAWQILLREVPSLESRLPDNDRLAGEAADTLVDAVTRVVRNPEGWRQVGLDDFQGTRDTVLSAGVLQFTEDEISRLQPRVVYQQGVYSLRMSVPYWGD